MAVELSDGFKLKAKTFNFERDSFKTVSAMTNADLNDYPDAFLATCEETHQAYILNEPNGTWDPIGGSGNSSSNISANTNTISGDVLSSLTINDKSYLILDKVGELSALTTSAQSCVVSAINEVVEVILENERIQATAMDELDMRIGDPADLETEEKYCIVDAINEVFERGVYSGSTISGGTKVSANTGIETSDVLSSLTIDDKTYLVNGSKSIAYSAGTAITINSGNTISLKISRVNGNIISALTDGIYASAITSSISANTNITSGDVLSSITINDKSYIILDKVGELSALTTSAQSCAVSAINEVLQDVLDNEIVTKAALLALHKRIGILSALTTEDQDSIVDAINEINKSNTTTILANQDVESGDTLSSLTINDKSYFVNGGGTEVSANTNVESGETLSSITINGASYVLNYVEKVDGLPDASSRTEGTVVNNLQDGKLYVAKKDTVTMTLDGVKYHFDNSIDNAYYYTNGSQKLYTDGDWDDYLTYDSAHTLYCSAIDEGKYYDWYCYESDNDILYVFNDDNFDEPNTEIDYINIYNEYSLNFQINLTQSEQNEYDDTTRTDTMIEVNLGDRVNPDRHTFKKGPIYLLTYLMGEKNSDNYGKLYWEEVVNDEIYTVSQSIKTCETPIYPTIDFEIGDKYIDTVDNHGTHIYTKINDINQVKIIKGYSATTNNIISTNNQGEMYWNDLVEITLTPSTTGIVQSYLLELPMNWHGTGYLLDSSNTTPLTFTFACGSAEVVSVANPTTTFPARLFQGFGTNVNKFILTFYLNHSIKLCVSGYRPTDIANIYSLTASGVPSNPTLSFRPINGMTYDFACATSNLNAISTLSGYTLDDKCYYSKQVTATSGVFTPTIKDWCEYSVLYGNYTTAATSINTTNYPTTINKHTRFNLANQTLENATLKIYKNVGSYKYYLLGYLSSYTEYVISFPTGCFLDLTFGFTSTLYNNSNTKNFVREEGIGVINSNLFGPNRLGSIEASANT